MGRKFISKMLLILLVMTLLLGCEKQTETEVNEAVAVEIETATLREIEEVTTLRGQLKPSEEFMIFIKTPGLKVTDLSVQTGDQVKEGAFLFELDKTLGRKQVEQAKMNYDIALENYNNQRKLMQNNGENIKNLQEEENLGFDISVFKSMGRIPSQYQHMIGSQMNQGQANGGVNSQGMEVSMMTASAQLEQARMAYTNSIEQLGELEYYAPIDGVVSQINLQKNQMAMNNTPAMVISNTEDLKVILSVSATLLEDLQKGQALRIRNGDEGVEGVVRVLNPISDIRSNLHTVEILINNHQKNFKPGGFVHVDILRNRKDNVIVIPKDAIVTEEKESFVFIEKDGKAQRKKVKIGIDAGDKAEVIEGIQKGDRVIVKGQHYIEDLTPVTLRGDKGENR